MELARFMIFAQAIFLIIAALIGGILYIMLINDIKGRLKEMDKILDEVRHLRERATEYHNSSMEYMREVMRARK